MKTKTFAVIIMTTVFPDFGAGVIHFIVISYLATNFSGLNHLKSISQATWFD